MSKKTSVDRAPVDAVVMRWTPIDESLPELEQVVWCWNGREAWIGIRSYVANEGWFWCDAGTPFWNARKGRWDSDMADMDDHPPTHWLAFPLPPSA